jgi:replication factor C small subunit
MTKVNNKEYIWVEKYRPQTVADIIIPEEIRSKILNWSEDKQIPNIGIFSNTPGTGKTSVSKAIINDIGADAMFVNASKDNGIDMVRGKLQGFASSVSFEGNTKIAVLDEADGLTGEMQKAFRSSIEEFSKNCRYIITGNYKDRIIEPILNRLVVFDFDNIFYKNKSELAKQMYSRLCFILDNEKVEYEVADVRTLIGTFYPSVREMINVLQQSIDVVDGRLILKIDYTHTELNKLYNELVSNIKAKNFEQCRVLVTQLNTPNGFYKFIYNNLDTLFDKNSIPQVVVMTHHFMSSNVNSRDYEISVAAFCARLITSIDIKFI